MLGLSDSLSVNPTEYSTVIEEVELSRYSNLLTTQSRTYCILYSTCIWFMEQQHPHTPDPHPHAGPIFKRLKRSYTKQTILWTDCLAIGSVESDNGLRQVADATVQVNGRTCSSDRQAVWVVENQSFHQSYSVWCRHGWRGNVEPT